MQISAAVTIALTHIDAWGRHDWGKTKELLATEVRAWVTNTQPNFGRTVEFTVVDDTWPRKVKGARLVEPGFRWVDGDHGESCLYSPDKNKKIKEERGEFLVL